MQTLVGCFHHFVGFVFSAGQLETAEYFKLQAIKVLFLTRLQTNGGGETRQRAFESCYIKANEKQ